MFNLGAQARPGVIVDGVVDRSAHSRVINALTGRITNTISGQRPKAVHRSAHQRGTGPQRGRKASGPRRRLGDQRLSQCSRANSANSPSRNTRDARKDRLAKGLKCTSFRHLALVRNDLKALGPLDNIALPRLKAVMGQDLIFLLICKIHISDLQ